MNNLHEDVLSEFAEAQSLGERRGVEGVMARSNGAAETRSHPGGSTPLFTAAEAISIRPKHDAWNPPEQNGQRLCRGYGRTPHWMPLASFLVPRGNSEAWKHDAAVAICAECRQISQAWKAARAAGWNLAIVDEIDASRSVMFLVVCVRGVYRYEEPRLEVMGSAARRVGDKVWVKRVDVGTPFDRYEVEGLSWQRTPAPGAPLTWRDRR